MAKLVEELQSDCRNFVPLPLRQRSYAEAASEPSAALKNTQYVYIRRGGVQAALAAKYDGLYKVMSRGPKFFDIQIGNKTDSVTVDRLKPHLGAEPVEAATPPRRGRPPGKPPLGSVVSQGGSVAPEEE
jgi:hypothetical protein